MEQMFLGLREVLRCCGVSRATLYLWVSRGLFPPPRQLGPRRVAWARADGLFRAGRLVSRCPNE